MDVEPHSSPATILEVLSEDCWRLVLDYLTIKEIVRSESVSRDWRRVVLNYLQGVRNFCIITDNIETLPLPVGYRFVHLSTSDSFNGVVRKIGPLSESMVVHDINAEKLAAIAQNCHKLKGLEIVGCDNDNKHIRLEPLLRSKQLKWMSFVSLPCDDEIFEIVVRSKILEELSVIGCKQVTGRFLTNLRSNLKSLIFTECSQLEIGFIQSAVQHLAGLTRLELNDNSSETLKNVHLLLNQMPNLEQLALMNDSTTELGSEVPASIGRLGRLRELHLCGNENVTDEWLAAAARGCPALRTVDVAFCKSVTARGLIDLCQALPNLTELVVASLPEMTDETLEACARCCGCLALLDADSSRVWYGLPMNFGTNAAKPLRLRLLRAPVEVAKRPHDCYFIITNRTLYPCDRSILRFLTVLGVDRVVERDFTNLTEAQFVKELGLKHVDPRFQLFELCVIL